MAHVEGYIKWAELEELFGIPFKDPYGDWHQLYGSFLGDVYIGFFDGVNRTISWSDTGEQPKKEWLYKISFCSGAYIFGQHYPTELFHKFWLELLKFSPSYSDTANHALYFTHENAKIIHEAFPEICKKYIDIVKEDKKRMDIEKMEKELARMKRETKL